MNRALSMLLSRLRHAAQAGADQVSMRTCSSALFRTGIPLRSSCCSGDSGAAASLETKRRLEQILSKTSEITPERLREGRALMALEWIGTPEALRLLTALAGGAADDALTREAAAARGRLGRRD